MSADMPWNPEDGPPPTDEERAAAEALGAALDARSVPSDPDLRDLAGVAGRITATAHPNAERDRATAVRVTDGVLAASSPASARRQWLVRRVLPFAAAASVLLVAGGLGSRSFAPTPRNPPSISRNADDVLRAPMGDHPTSSPTARLDDARHSAWRDLMLRGGTR